ncbi:MAG: DUF4838 domain-containing protein [Victivallales bacterium]|nr:DUF4838 domain-containing protein [Victivallales bacterium]
MKRTLFLLLAFLSLLLPAAEITLAENGLAKATIVIPEQPKPIVKYAAAELAEHLQKMTGATFPIGFKPGNDVNIYLGFGNADGFQADEYVLNAQGSRIDIYGKDTSAKVNLFNYFYDNPDKGTLCGVYCFLDSLGVRWLAPGQEGMHVPDCKTLRIQEQSIRFKPFFQDRQICDAWNFMKMPDAKEYATDARDLYRWGLRNHVSTRNMVAGCHSERSLKLHENPEWLTHPTAHQLMKDGTRNPKYSCWTDPFTKEIWLRAVEGYFSGRAPKECGFDLNGYLHSQWPMPFISPDEFMIDPMDHGKTNDGRCWCDRCQDFRKKHPCQDDTEIIWQVIGDIAKQVELKYPGKYISTLVYPPKKLLPKTIETPKNIRIRICMQGPRNMVFPEMLENDLKLLKTWGDFLGPRNIPLWVYQCAAGFGLALPGVIDTYPHLIARFIQEIKPLCAGMMCENHNLTHTCRNLDVYVFMRLMWNPDLDVEKELEEYFRFYYGPSAQPAKELFDLFEKNWLAIDTRILRKKQTEIGLAISSREQFQKAVWSQVYTAEVMKQIDSLMQRINLLAPEATVYARRARILQKNLVQIMKDERSDVMDKEERRNSLNLPVSPSTAKEFPAAQEWSQAQAYQLLSAQRMSPELKAGGSFRLLASADTLFIRVELKEPKMADSKTDARHQPGNVDIWRDNCIELFFHAEKTRKFWQLIVNDNNAWSCQIREKVLNRWEMMPGLRVKTQRQPDGWTAEIAVPLKEIDADKGNLRFNLTRERNVKGEPPEYSTWSPLAMLGNWHGVDNYGTILLPPKASAQ